MTRIRPNNWKSYRKHFRRIKGFRYRKKMYPLKKCIVPIGLAYNMPVFKRPVRAISLFDGVSSGLAALDSLRMQVGAYFSSEVCKAALEVQRYQYPGRLVMLGCVKKIDKAVLECILPIDLLLGGSPCSDLSSVNWRRKGFADPDSTARLFYEYVRIRNWLRDAAAAQGRPFHYLFENTRAMERTHRDHISEQLGVQPVLRDAKDYSGMNRARYFWTNIPCGGAQGAVPGMTLQHFLHGNRTANCSVLPTVTTVSSSQRVGPNAHLPVSLADGTETHLLVTEVEALFGFPRHFTDTGSLSITARRKLLGLSWCVPLVSDLLRPLTELYKLKDEDEG